MIKKLLLILVIGLLAFSCKKSSSNSDYNDESDYAEEEMVDSYPDGTYCAEVEYYNPNTGTRNTYTLNVDVENHEVTVIHWPNGGWLDDDHFYPVQLDDSGYCSFTSDKGYVYSIRINGPECSYTDESNMQSDINDDHDAVTCPECGGEKDEYDDLCYDCKRKQEEGDF